MPKKSARSSVPLTRESRTAYEAVRLPSLDALVLEQLKEVITFSRVAGQGYAICICNIPRLREDLISILTENLKPDRIGIYQVRLTANEWSLGRKIRILQRDEKFLRFKNHYQKVVVSVTGLDETIQDSELKDYKNRPAPLQGINQQRDYFRTLPFPLLIWVPEWLAARLPEFTPDFWVGRSMVFEFLSASEAVSQSISQLSGMEIAYENLDEAKRKMRIYEKLIKSSEDKSIKSVSLHNLGVLHQMQGNYSEAEKLYKQSLKIAEELGDKSGIASSLHQLGNIHCIQGNYPEAEKLYKQSLKIEKELGDKSGIAGNLHQLGMIQQHQGNYSEAEKLYKQSLKIKKELGDKSGIARSLHQLGNIHYIQGNYPEAENLYKQSLKIAEELGDKSGIAKSIGQLGRIAEEQGDDEKALKNYFIALKIFKELQSPDIKIVETRIAEMRKRLSKVKFQNLYKRALSALDRMNLRFIEEAKRG